MLKALTGVLLVGVLLFAAAPPTAATVYNVTLNNGGIIHTRQAPIAVDYLPGRLLVLTEVGNWVGLVIDDIRSIKTDTEARGFGTVLDTTTISLGLAPNDRVEPEELDSQQRMMQLMEQRSRPRENYSVQQFAEPSQSGGIPIWMTGVTTPPLGGAGLSSASPVSGAEPRQ